jgi:hypothetical protein
VGLTFDEAKAWLTGLVGREVQVVAYQIGSSTFALAEELFVSGERVGNSIALELIDHTEIVAFPWRGD